MLYPISPNVLYPLILIVFKFDKDMKSSINYTQNGKKRLHQFLLDDAKRHELILLQRKEKNIYGVEDCKACKN